MPASGHPEPYPNVSQASALHPTPEELAHGWHRGLAPTSTSTIDVIRAGSFASVNDLVRDIETYLVERNANPKPYKWKANDAEILSKLKRARTALDRAGGLK
jgi:hypothetical protein